MGLEIDAADRPLLYHGTILGNLGMILANSISHTSGKRVAYFTEDRCYALVCCRSRGENFVTMGLRDDGKQHYFERFPEQLKTLYAGRQGWLYIPEAGGSFHNTKGRSWESETDVPVARCEHISDVYAELLKEERAGHVVIHRYAEIDPAEQKLHANHIRAHLGEEGAEMQRFLISHFSTLWDPNG